MASDSLHYAVRALRKEILEFNFDYPVDVVLSSWAARLAALLPFIARKLKRTVIQLDGTGSSRAGTFLLSQLQLCIGELVIPNHLGRRWSRICGPE